MTNCRLFIAPAEVSRSKGYRKDCAIANSVSSRLRRVPGISLGFVFDIKSSEAQMQGIASKHLAKKTLLVSVRTSGMHQTLVQRISDVAIDLLRGNRGEKRRQKLPTLNPKAQKQ